MDGCVYFMQPLRQHKSVLIQIRKLLVITIVEQARHGPDFFFFLVFSGVLSRFEWYYSISAFCVEGKYEEIHLQNSDFGKQVWYTPWALYRALLRLWLRR
jgi:hypothetical protein